MEIDVPAFNAEEWPDLSRGTQGTVASADTRFDVVVNPDNIRHREHRYYQLKVFLRFSRPQTCFDVKATSSNIGTLTVPIES